jgi:hypothetical protein
MVWGVAWLPGWEAAMFGLRVVSIAVLVMAVLTVDGRRLIRCTGARLLRLSGANGPGV